MLRRETFTATIPIMTGSNPPKIPPMSDAEADAYIAAMATALALPLTDADPQEIRANLLVARRMAAMLADAPPCDHVEPLPVFRA